MFANLFGPSAHERALTARERMHDEWVASLSAEERAEYHAELADLDAWLDRQDERRRELWLRRPWWSLKTLPARTDWRVRMADWQRWAVQGFGIGVLFVLLAGAVELIA